jgi:hypothetical protein
MSANVLEALAREIMRVSEGLHHYDEIPTGRGSATLIRHQLDAACTAIGSGDVAAQAAFLQELREVKI